MSEYTNRTGWEFQFATEKVKAAAEAKKAHHEERLQWWEHERARVKDLLKDGTIHIEERQYTGGSDYEAQIDPNLAKRLHEAQKKIEWHRERVKDFAAWCLALAAHSGVLKLRIDDVRFFNLSE